MSAKFDRMLDLERSIKISTASGNLKGVFADADRLNDLIKTLTVEEARAFGPYRLKALQGA